METKICKKCHLEKPITEFNKHRGECKACVKEYNRKYHQENREKIAEKKKIYNETHKEQIAEMYHNYYLNNMEKKKAYAKEYVEKNREMVLAKKKIYRDTHKDEWKEYYETHKDYFKEYKKTPRYKEQQREYQKAHKERYKELRKNWALNNPEKIQEIKKKAGKKYRETHKEKRKAYIEANRDRINETKRIYETNRRQNDMMYSFINRIRALIYISFAKKGYKKNSHSYEILGCDYKTFMQHLLQTFKENYGYEWDGIEEVHIDHIVPLATAKSEEDVVALCYYENLQLLKAKDNLEKHDKLDWKLKEE